MAKYRKLSRTSSQRKALLRGQVTALLNNGKIVTTEAKAKEVRKIAEGIIALAVKEKDNYEEVTVKAKVARKDKDGASEWKVFLKIVMPNVKPAWLTLIIFSVQNLWNNRASTYIYTEKRKTLVYALQQIQSGGVARTGQMAAVSVIVMIVPIIVFVLSQSQVLETMASSGIKE